MLTDFAGGAQRGTVRRNSLAGGKPNPSITLRRTSCILPAPWGKKNLATERKAGTFSAANARSLAQTSAGRLTQRPDNAARLRVAIRVYLVAWGVRLSE